MPKNFRINNADIRRLIDWQGAAGCIVTDRITVDGAKIGFMYREEPANAMDCGWRFFEGPESDEYLADPRNMSVFDINAVCNYDRDIIPFIGAPVGSAFERDEKGVFRQAE